MSHDTFDSVPRPSLRDRLRSLRDSVDWMMLFPAVVAVAWIFGQTAIAMVLVVVLPTFLALQGRSSGLIESPSPARDTAVRRPMTRRALQDFIDQVLEDCTQREKTTAVLQMQINDMHVPDSDWGSEVSERVLDRVVQRIASTMRGQDAVIRSGEALLTVVLQPTNRADLDVLMNIIDRLQAAVSEPISLDGRSVRVQAAIGFCSETASPSRSGAALLSAADCALRAALRQGEDAVRGFNADLQTQVETHHQLSTQIDAALDAGQIRPWFQPQLTAETGHVAGFEALARWDHPDLGVLTPDQFLPAVVAAGRMVELGELILRSGLDALVAWDKAGIENACLSMNISLEELSDPRLAEKLCWQVDRHGLTPGRVAFELTEAVAMREDDEAVVRNIHALREAGFKLDLDRFGTGGASIAHVARFGVHRIKLDRSFVHDINNDPSRRTVVAAVLSMARTLGIETLAQGVETPEERAVLSEMGCDQVQGFGLARPMPLEDTETWALARRTGEVAALRTMRPQGTA